MLIKITVVRPLSETFKLFLITVRGIIFEFIVPVNIPESYVSVLACNLKIIFNAEKHLFFKVLC